MNALASSALLDGLVIRISTKSMLKDLAQLIERLLFGFALSGGIREIGATSYVVAALKRDDYIERLFHEILRRLKKKLSHGP